MDTDKDTDMDIDTDTNEWTQKQNRQRFVKDPYNAIVP
jgi:hypothetical protein